MLARSKNLTAIFVLLALSGCSLIIRAPQSSNSTIASSSCANVSQSVSQVQPVYPNHANWNQYVHNAGGIADTPYNQSDVNCSGTENWYLNCTHGGERRKVTGTGLANCKGLTATDSLGAFSWTCDSSQNPPVFYSRALNTGKGLGTLINPSSLQFYPLGLTVTDSGGCTVLSAPPSAQWKNPIVDLVAGGYISTTVQKTLPGTGSIYILKSGTSTQSDGIHLLGNGTGLVVMPGSTLQWAGVAGGNCNGSSALVCTDGQYQWVEGAYDGYHPTNLVSVGAYDVSSSFSRYHLFSFKNAGSQGMRSNGHNLYDQVSIGNVTGSGFVFSFANFSQVYQLAVNNTTGNGIDADGISHMRMNQIFTSNVNAKAFSIQATSAAVTDVLVSQLTITNSSACCQMFFNIAQGALTNTLDTFSHLSILNSNALLLMAEGFGTANDNNHNTYNDVLIANFGASSVALNINAVQNDAFYDLAIEGSGANSGIVNDANTSLTTNFDGSLRIKGFAIPCSNTQGSFLLNGANCFYSPGLSKAPTLGGFDFGLTFQGVVSSDTYNQSSGGGLGTQTYPAVSDTNIDWINFVDPLFRGWGLSGIGTFIDSSRNGPCNAGSPNCQMYDTRVLSSDSNANALNFYGSWNSSLPNCPLAVDGAGGLYPGGSGNVTIITDQAGHTYLKNAVEIPFDDAPGANNNGLCESGEKCIFAPNAGAYQGSDDFTAQTCIFHSGTISNVTMYAYPVNGL